MHNLQPTEWMGEKIIQINSMLAVRHGVMIIGDPMSAKTKVIFFNSSYLKNCLEICSSYCSHFLP